MRPEIGSVLDGKVTGIMKFGAFVALPGGISGLVHISEIANAYVNDVSQYVQVGQDVRVKVIRITDDGKISLSIKQAMEPAPQEHRPCPAREGAGVRQEQPRRQYQQREGQPRQDMQRSSQPYRQSAPAQRSSYVQAPPVNNAQSPTTDQDFEDKLKRFMKESDSRIADNKIYADHTRRTRKR